MDAVDRSLDRRSRRTHSAVDCRRGAADGRCGDTVARHVARCLRAARQRNRHPRSGVSEHTAGPAAVCDRNRRHRGTLARWRACWWPPAARMLPARVRMAQQLTADQAPYLDLLVLDDAMAGAGVASLATARRAIPGLKILRRAQQGDTARIVRDTLSSVATDTLATRGKERVEDLAAAVAALTPAANLLSHPVQEIDPVAGWPHPQDRWRRCSPHAHAPAAVRRADVCDVSLVRRRRCLATRVDVALRLAVAGPPAVHDLIVRTTGDGHRLHARRGGSAHPGDGAGDRRIDAGRFQRRRRRSAHRSHAPSPPPARCRCRK